MNADTMRELVRTIQADRSELASKLSKTDKVLDNLRDLYPDLFASDGRPPAPAPAVGHAGEPNGGTPAIFPAADTKSIVDYIFADLQKSAPETWLSPKEVAGLATEYGWKPPEDSPDPVAVVRTRVSRMTTLESRPRDGRTKEYRLKTPGDVVDATSPGPVSSQRAGGDDDADPPATAQDHDPSFGRRDDRDLNREIPERVAVQL